MIKQVFQYNLISAIEGKNQEIIGASTKVRKDSERKMISETWRLRQSWPCIAAVEDKAQIRSWV